MKLSNSNRIAIVISIFTFLVSIVFLVLLNYFSFKAWYNAEKQELSEISLGYNVYSQIFDELLKGVPDKTQIDDFITENDLNSQYDKIFFQLYKNYDKYYLIEKADENLYAKYDVTIFVRNQILQVKIGLLLAMLFTILAFVLSKILFSRLILKELYLLSESLEKLDISSQKMLENKFYDKEIKFIVEKINKLLKNIYTYQENLKHFNSQVAHEFNTPLMVINSELEYLSLSGIENESLQKISFQVAKLNNLLNSFILLSKLENHQIELENVDVKQILDEVLSELQTIYKNKNIQVETEIATSKIKTNKNLFKILLKNLLDNAFKYNTNNGKIQIKLDKNQLIVSNTSKNFKEYKLENLLKMFYKNNSQSGFGIGLAIVDKIARKLGYKLEISYEKEVFNVKVIF